MTTIEILLSDKTNTLNDNILTFFEKNIEIVNKNSFYIEFIITNNKKVADLKECGINSLPALKYTKNSKETVIKQGCDDIISYIKTICTKGVAKGPKINHDEQIRELMKEEIYNSENDEDENDAGFNDKDYQKKLSEFNKRRQNRAQPSEENKEEEKESKIKTNKKKPHQLNTPITKGPSKSTYQIDRSEAKEDKDIMDKIAQETVDDDDMEWDADDAALLAKG